MKRRIMALLISLFILMPVSGALAELADGIYEATAPGMNGDVTARAVVLDGKIAMITAKHDESAEVGAPAIDELIRRAIDVQDPDVDIVTGATQTSEAFVEAMKAALTQAGWEEEDLEWEIIERRTPELVAEVSAPQISFDNVASETDGVVLISGDTVVINWHAEGDVQGYYLTLEDAQGGVVRQLHLDDTFYALPRSMLSEGQTYTLTVTAIPANGTLEANGVSASARFALYIAPNPEPTPESVLQTGEISDSWEQIIAAIEDGMAKLQTGEISDSWEQIIAAIEDGTAKQRYAVGATKALDLGTLGIIHMQLAGFDLDERADGNGKASTTWIAVELLPERHPMNEANTATGGWQDSDLRAYLHNTLLPTIPEAVQKKLIRVKKQQRDNIVGQYQTTEDLVWIPDRDELFGNNSLYYGLFEDSSEKRVKRYTGSAAWWWLRSADGINYFYAVYTYGNTSNYTAYYSGGVALGFCL